MKFSILQENIEKGLSIVNHIVSQKAQLPILNHVLLKVKKNSIKLSATDLEIGIEITIGAKIEEEGEVAVPGRVLYELIASLSHEKITLSAQEQILTVETVKNKSTLLGINSSEFPKIFEGEKELLVEIEGRILKEMMEKCCFAASVDEGRPVLTGVMIRVGDKLEMVATDGYRLSKQVVKEREPRKKREVELLVPVRVFKQLNFVLPEKEEGQTVNFYREKTKNQIIITVGENMLVGRLIEGEFPPFGKIIPTSHSTSAVFDKEELTRGVKTSAIFARESANIIRMKLNQNGVSLSANAPQVGDNMIVLDAQVEGEENEIAFNSRFLLDLLSNIDAQELVFEMTGPLNPGVFKIKDDESFLHIIMPVRIQEETK